MSEEIRLVKGITVEYMTQSGYWAELIEMPFEEPNPEDHEDLETTAEKIHKLIYDADKVELTIHGELLCISGLDKNLGIFKTKYSYVVSP